MRTRAEHSQGESPRKARTKIRFIQSYLVLPHYIFGINTQNQWVFMWLIEGSCGAQASTLPDLGNANVGKFC